MPGWDANGMVREEMRRYSLRGSGWDDIFAQHCTALGALLAGRAVDAYAQLVAYTQPFLKVAHQAALDHTLLLFNLEQTRHCSGWRGHQAQQGGARCYLHCLCAHSLSSHQEVPALLQRGQESPLDPGL